MKKLTLFIVALILILLSFTGCEGLLGGEGPNPGGNPVETVAFTRIVLANDKIDVTELRSELIAMNKMLGTVDASEPATDGEIVIGDTDRAVTAQAKAKLDEIIAADGNCDTGYIIYCNGKSLAVYWKTESARIYAMSKLIDLCVKEKKLELDTGVISSDAYIDIELVNESKWEELRRLAGEDVYKALRTLDSYYDKEKMMGWFANLWDAEIGGFYYSISARDNEPFLPDIESTNQTVGWLYNNGFIDNYDEDVPEDIKILLVDFAKSLQSSVDGYFYHPQWPEGRENLNVDRYSRDLSWSTDIINRFTIDRDGDGVAEKQYPLYCAPEGTKCKEHAENGGECSFALAASSLISDSSVYLTSSVVSSASSAAVRLRASVVSPTASTSTAHPDYSSEAAFRNWLENTNTTMGSSSGNAQNINALQDTIIAKGYCTTLLDFLDEHQQRIYDETLDMGKTPTGLWTYEHTYNTVWGLLKYTPFYNDKNYGRELKYAEEIVRACLKVIMLPADKNYKLNDVYNQWQGMQALFNNVKKYAPEKLESLYEIVREGGAALIDNTILKLSDFKCNDGAFSFYTTRKSAFTMYGAQIAMGVEESDVNASVLACSTYRCAFSCFGYDVIKLGTQSDGERFMQMLREVEPINKIPVPQPSTIEFDSDYNFKDIRHDNQSGASTVTLEEDDSLESDNYILKYISGASQSSFGDGVYFKVGGNVSQNCTIVETNVRVVSSYGNNDILQIRLGDFYRLRLNRNGYLLRIYEMVEGAGAVEPALLVNNLEIGEWFKLRIEAYRADEEYDTPRFKIFINDKFVTETSCAYGANTVVNQNCNEVLFRSLKATVSEVHFDNCFFYGQYKEYIPGETEIEDDRK